ncbi:MAG: hypothetical protein Q8R35_02090 [bacterium]|nr:hypothetical protein [bacterium]
MRRITIFRPTLGETALAILGDLATATLATFYPHPYYHAFCAHARPKSFYNALRRLERKNFVGRRDRSGREEWHLTGAGEKLVHRIKVKLSYNKQQRWDGKWRLVIFDVPERIRDRRNLIRKELSTLGFYQLQKSVWVTPYPLPEKFLEIITELSLGRYFRIIGADAIRDDRDIRAFFFPRSN